MIPKNRRRFRRIPQVRPVRIGWEEQGEQRFAIGRCLDLSEVGMRIEIAQPVTRGARIMIAAEHIKFSGSASVRHVIRLGSRYMLGAELTQPIAGHTISELEGN
jgi:hypothetical protein